jgi:asparagine synthase (glutamine-hydrolysing)
MCGILTLFGEDVETPSYLLNHRGPDDYASKKMGKCRMDFYRLAINDLTPKGMQPFTRSKQMLVCNGEIYNHKQFRTHGEFESDSDCEVLIPLIESCGIKCTL